jgi:hypothetical protein
VSPAAAHERFELVALLFAEANDILFVHGKSPSWRYPAGRVRRETSPCNESVPKD